MNRKCEKCKFSRNVGGANVLDLVCTPKNKYISFGTIRAIFCKDFKLREFYRRK